MVRAIVRSADREGDTFESIVQGVVASPAFRLRRVPPLPAAQQTARHEPHADDPHPGS